MASTFETIPSSQDSSMANHDLLFLHHGESPGAVLVSQPLFGEKPKLGSVNPKSFACQ